MMALAGLAAVAWGSSDFVAGVGARRMPIRTVLFGSKLAGMLLAVAFLLARPGPWPTGSRLLLLSGAAGVIGLPAMGLLYRAMRDGTLALVAPVAAGAALVPLAWGVIRGDTLGPAALIGAAAALAGMTLASWPVTPATAPVAPAHRLAVPAGGSPFPTPRPVGPGRPAESVREGASPVAVNRPAALCAAGAAVGFGAYFVLLHEAAPADPYGATACARIAGGLLAVLLLFPWLTRFFLRRARFFSRHARFFSRLARSRGAARPSRPERSRENGRRGRWVLPAGVGVLDTVADGAFAVAAAAGTVGTAAVLAGMYPAVTVLLNTAVLRERLPRIHLVGVLSALVAVACLAA
ncbi:membrane protein [Actinoplanes sp. OR16]|uniref:EamA family transporter n=1 Tax=Actinoplanes sp. OR16 TaxID=946334 RepID=UPI000F702EC4|nr:hypothetical protein [Actinoplanes sp. OR16]BBH71410.1 membrane protein [Actinoplanes sp. OR16]